MKIFIENPTWEQLKNIRKIVYLITNLMNGRNYVGITMRSFLERYKSKNWHRWISNKELRADILKNGVENFKITLIECNIDDVLILNDLEHEYCLKYDAYYPCGYNIAKCGRDSNYKETFKLCSLKKAKNFSLKNIYTGEIINGKNIAKFCRDNGLCKRSISRVLNGKIEYAGIYTKPETDIETLYIFKHKIKTENYYEFISPDGILLEINDLRDFCKTNNLRLLDMVKVANNQKKHCKFYSNPNDPLKRYMIISPDNKVYEVVEGKLEDFGRKMNLSESTITVIVSEKFKTMNGWRLLKNKNIKPQKSIFRVKSPSNKIYTIVNLTEFAQLHNLSKSGLSSIKNGRQKHHRGWRLVN